MYAATYIQGGETVTVQAPTGGMTDGLAYLIDTGLFGIAITQNGASVLVGENAELETVGVHELPKTTGNAIVQGARCYWNAGAGEITGIASTHKLVGVAMKIASSGASKVEVRLNGFISN